ncbi:uncharacterized protein I303_108610 [Kwoniella dejecticola CBS 10117]|uniref:Uncharacterized protein n=1 Tax=Kwoniella dejecticola CBS 10117 TaxID=1296121 RepID=A0A1A5ZWW9_9TREE|nr:uncharacterized protein I303_07065 [Kwoniella dejecticola CBS 10117]OBR82306.1 hypothetical protein I303_07065 [Kwoniella dejecticola CBS 10117]
MLYALVFLILIIAIVLIWLVRVGIAANQRRQSHKYSSSSSLPSHMQDVSHRPTLSETAEDVVDRVGRHSRARFPQHETYQSRYGGSRAGAVNRVASDNASVTSLPAYGADTLPVPPAAVYDPTNVRPTPGGNHVTHVIPPSYTEVAPPKYSATTTQPGITV